MVAGASQVAGGAAVPVVMATAALDLPKRTSEHRRSNKPIMEKRRRARINNCLNELKTLILDAMKKDPARHSKLEKADILEMTVKHLESLQQQRPQDSLERFRAGFRECAAEVGRFPGLAPALRHRLLHHLDTCVTPAPDDATEEESGIFISSGPNSGVRLVPTRLSNGDIALVLPSAGVQSPAGMPARSCSTSSASSSSSGIVAEGCSSPGSAWSASPPPASPGEPVPLALVTRRDEYDDDDKPWRPW